MRNFQVRKSKLTGEITIPPSKSQTLRAILFASLAYGKSTIYNYLNSPDTFCMIEACRQFGATITVYADKLEIIGLNGQITHTEDVIQAGNSGIVLRFCAALSALGSHPAVITGDYSIRHQRPMHPLIQGLKKLGVNVESMRGDNFAPLIIKGPLKPGHTTLDGSDSQHVSALLIASAFALGPTTIEVSNAGEKPWIDMTLYWFDRLGIPYKNLHYQNYEIKGMAQYPGFNYSVPGDFSSAAFPLAAALVTQSSLKINNLDMNDPQGDKKVVEVFRKMGAKIDIKNNYLYVHPNANLEGSIFDINDFIDAITILATTACFAKGKTILKNIAVAKTKECNRVTCIIEELSKMGAIIQETNEGLEIYHSSLKGATLDSYNDHRMAMSLAIAAMGATGLTKINPIDCINKTFPTFIQDFQALGANLEVME